MLKLRKKQDFILTLMCDMTMHGLQKNLSGCIARYGGEALGQVSQKK